MPDFIGNVLVPEIAPHGTPLSLMPDYGHGRAHPPKMAVHRFRSGNTKIEHRFLIGTGPKRFTFVRTDMSEPERVALRDYFEARQGPYQPWPYSYPDADGGIATFTVRFAGPLAWSYVGHVESAVQVELIEVPTSEPSYTLTATLNRSPNATLNTGLLPQVQELFPLLKIAPKTPDYPATFLSDRRCIVGGQLYLARLLQFDGIQQSLGGESDQASFTFGNADRVMTSWANDTNLVRASIEFSLFHVQTGIKLDLWKGEVLTWNSNEGPEFSMVAADGLYELNLPYPPRHNSRACWKDFNDGQACPAATAGGTNLGDPCDKGFDTPLGCVFHNMQAFHGGIAIKPQRVNLKQRGALGLSSIKITSVSAVSDTVYGRVLRRIYTDAPMPVQCDIAAGREELEFYDALGIVGAGPLTSYGQGHTLDDQPNHGPGNLGLRRSYGHDPVQNLDPDGDSDKFSLGEGNPTVYGPERAAGVAFLEIRRTDPKGQQLSRITDHNMVAVVSGGLSGFIWSAPGMRTTGLLTNPIWIAINALIEAKGMQFADAADQETLFDVAAAVAAADICNLTVTKLHPIGTVETETQFKYRGVIQEQKPLRDWISEILMNCLGYFNNSFAKLKIGIRVNSSAVEAFTLGNVILGSLELTPIKPEFNHIQGIFGDEDYDWQENSLEVYDVNHAKLIGGATAPTYHKSRQNFSGLSSKSRVSRVISTRLREELGGITAAEWRAARNISFKTTVLALNTEPGMICSLTHPDMPGGTGEFRVHGWRLNPDYSIDIQGRTTTDSMYDLAIGPKPADVVPDAVPIEYFPAPFRPVWHPDAVSPPLGDPLFVADEAKFALVQQYIEKADASVQLRLSVTGKMPVNSFVQGARPAQIGSLVMSDSAGSMTGDSYLYLSVCPFDADGNFGPPSNVVSALLGPGNLWSATMNDITWPPGTWAGYILGGSDFESALCVQREVTGALPSSITEHGPLLRSTWTFPNPNWHGLRLKAKTVYHAGVLGLLITSISEGVIVCNDIAGHPEDWTGRIASIITDRSDGEAALWNFTIISFNATLGEFTFGTDPQVLGVEVGDVLIVSAMATAATDMTITDSGFTNGTYPTGMNANEEVGRLVRIISGTGKGQLRRVVANDSETLTVDEPWSVIPDATTMFIVEAPTWENLSETTAVFNSNADKMSELGVVVDNLADTTLLVMVVGVDMNGGEATEYNYSPWRLIYVHGAPGSVLTNEIVIQYA